MFELLRKLNSGVLIQAELDIEVNDKALHLSVYKKEAIVRFETWKDGFAFARAFGADTPSFKDKFVTLDSELKRLEITVYLRKQSVPILGSKANPLYSFLVRTFTPVFSRQ